MSAEGIVLRPALRAKAGELFWFFVALILSLASPFLGWELWGALVAVAIALSALTIRKKAIGVVIPLVVAAVSKRLGRPSLAVAGAALALVELLYVITYVRSVKYVFKDDGLVISVEFPLYSKTRSIPRSSIAEVTVESSLAGKVLGYANVIVKLRSGEVVVITGVPKKKAQELTKRLLSE